MNTPKRIDLKPEQIEALLERVKNGSLQDGDYEIIKAMSEIIEFLSQLSEEKAASIKRLLKMMFGSSTEKTDTVTKKPKPGGGNTKPKSKKKGHGRNGAADYTGAEKTTIDHGELKHKDPCPVCLKGKVYVCKQPKTLVRVTGSSPLTASVYELEKLRCNLCGEIFTANAHQISAKKSMMPPPER